MTKILLVEIVSIIIQHPSNPFDPVVKDMFQFRPLRLIQKRLKVIKKVGSTSELLSLHCGLHVAGKPEV
jgi:hypothetical protein